MSIVMKIDGTDAKIQPVARIVLPCVTIRWMSHVGAMVLCGRTCGHV